MMVGVEEVVTVTSRGEVLGSMPRICAHRKPGTLHLAVSVQLFDDADRCLLQRRAAGKALFANRWANTCCSHPRPGEDPVETAERRLREELGLVCLDLRRAGTFVYRAVDRESGWVEHELDHVFVGRLSDIPVPAEDEISELTFASLAQAPALLSSRTGAPWAAQVLEIACAAAIHLPANRRRP